MQRGWIKNYRKELKSDVWAMPPIYARVWQLLKLSVNFEEKKVPMRDGSFMVIKPGQHLTSVRTIANSVGWYERGLWKEPNPKTIQDVLEWLEKQNMITLDHGKGNRKFTLITLVNWDIYQRENDCEETETVDQGNNEESDNEQMMDINNKYNNANNDKEKKEEKEKNKSMYLMDEDKYSEGFESFWLSYPRRIEKKRAYRVWKQRLKEKVVEEDMISAALNYGKYSRDRNLEERFIKHPATFLGKDKPFEEFILSIPEGLKKEAAARNVSKAMDLYERVQAGGLGEVELW